MTEFNTGAKVTADHREQWTGTIDEWTGNETEVYHVGTYIPVKWEFGARYIERIEALKIVRGIACKYCDDPSHTGLCPVRDLSELLLLGAIKERGAGKRTLELVEWSMVNQPHIRKMVRDSNHLALIAKVFIWAFDLGWVRAMENPEWKENE